MYALESHGVTRHLRISRDFLLFESWKPTSAGETFWFCNALLVMSLLDRFVGGLRGRFGQDVVFFTRLWYRHSPWTRRQYKIVSDTLPEDQDRFSIELGLIGDTNVLMVESRLQKRVIVAPFIPNLDLPRGLLHTTHVLFSYISMLAAMSVSEYTCSPSRVLH